MNESNQNSTSVPLLIDTHCHIQSDEFKKDVDHVIARAESAGVQKMIVVGGAGPLSTNETGLELCERYPTLFATVGMHPHDARDVGSNDLNHLKSLTGNPKVVAVGETGLDFHYDHSPRDVQERVFIEFIQLAREVALPVVVHVRDAHREAAALIRSEGKGGLTGVIHCFTGDWNAARSFLDLGFYLSFTGIITFKTATDLREVVLRVPIDRILLETDSPYLAPVPHRGKRNEPAFVREVAEVVATVKGLSLDKVATTTSDNAHALFGI